MADDGPISHVTFKNIDIVDPTYSGIMLKSETFNKSPAQMDVAFDSVKVVKPGTNGILVQDAMGKANFMNTKLLDVSGQPIRRNKNTNGKKGTGVIELVTDEACAGIKE
jgi:hypothetical protein